MNDLCFKKADILLPRDVPFEKWSVVACDQYTSQPEYWKDVEKITEGEKSALNLIFPEIYLSDNNEKRINGINEAMKNYLEDNTFVEYKNSLIYLERKTGENKIRHGIIGVIDLERYEFTKQNNAKIRATEGTVQERIPPRVEIRKDALLELPHVMLLYNDRENSVVNSVEKGETLYDFELMKNSGSIKGFLIDNPDCVLEKISKLEKDNMLFAVGDGNHSLATAKTCWDNIKNSVPDFETNKARFALVEIVNIHDSALIFEPIHRIVSNVDTNALISAFEKEYTVSYEKNEGQKITFLIKGKKKDVYVTGSQFKLAVGTLQTFLDRFLKENGGSIDYIHGEDVVASLSEKENSIGFLLPAIDKNDFFESIIKNGSLPRKTFSMGEAFEKRFYLEARKIK